MTETVDSQEPDRSFIDRLRASAFLSDLFSNRLALAGLGLVLSIVIIGIYARLAFDFETLIRSNIGAAPNMAPPSRAHPFGTDIQSRDIFKRTLYGCWLALKFGTVVVLASTVLGITLGIVAAYYGDLVDNTIMRTMDVFLAFPSLLLALAIVAIAGSGMWRVVVALIVVYTPRFARVVRGTALKVLEDEYIDATVALGAKDPRILFRHIAPNCVGPITVQSTINFGLAILDLAALSFLGFGADPGTPSWGLMLSNGVDNGLLTGQWWWSFFPGLFLGITVLGFNLLGDGMRDALDPRMREAVE